MNEPFSPEHQEALLRQIERIAQKVTYLGQRLHETHVLHSAAVRERDDAEGRYRVLRGLALRMVEERGIPAAEDRNYRRLRALLGLTQEEEPH